MLGYMRLEIWRKVGLSETDVFAQRCALVAVHVTVGLVCVCACVCELYQLSAVCVGAERSFSVPGREQRAGADDEHALSDDVLHGARPTPDGGARRGRGTV